jgi:diaminohydroxyphosphoribosylaminopyrimidine deaminase / 5-amino-6-(5-phosphoribosylamino)uracil reductase
MHCVFWGRYQYATDLLVTNSVTNDLNHMRAALALARRGLGTTWPNPSVGCVLVRDGRVIGRGSTGLGGRPHAEPTALSMAGDSARGATAYVTLEPCCHWGHTPPCTEALIQAKVARVVIATLDPDKRVDGLGVARLREAGINVEYRLLQDDARDDLQGFFLRINEKRPLITLKLASTLDGKIATGTGKSQWITGPEARRMAHVLRGRNDAVLIGVGTAIADNPELTCRIVGFRESQIVRVVADSFLRTPLTSNLARTAGNTPLWFLICRRTDPSRRDAFIKLGATVIEIESGEMGINLIDGVKALALAGLTRVLVEGGGHMAASFIRADLVDRIAWLHAPAVMGGDGWPSVQGLGIPRLAMMPRFIPHRVTSLGPDTLTEFKRLF